MARELLRKQDDYVGVHRREILETFGDQTGLCDCTEMAPVYPVETAGLQPRETWQIVYRIDKSREVQEMVVNKNRC